MRITSNTYSNLLINSSQNSQQQLAQIQQEVSTGDSVQFPSDNPLVYQQASTLQQSLAELNAYNTAASTATAQTSTNNTAITNLHQIVAQTSELATSVGSLTSSADMKAIGTQVSSLISEMINTVNQKSSDGTYLFGGTANQPPIDAATQTYNNASNSQTSSIEVQQGNSVQTSIVAGRSTGSPPVDGFLCDSATGVDVLSAMQQTLTDLNNGNSNAVQTTDLTALNNALNHLSLYVGSTAASMSAVQTATNSNQAQITAQDNQLNGLTQTNLPDATVQLQQIQNQYEATLSAGSRLLNLSILNYIGSVGSS